MAVFRVEKNRNFTTMSNYHLRDKNLSLKAKGLLSMCLSLTDDWDYSINGLVAISLEGRTAIMNTVQELEKAGYILRKQTRGPDGKMGKAEYTIREAPAQPPAEDAPQSGKPQSENPTTVNPTADNPTSEEPTADNPPQLITDQLNTDLINNGEKKEARHRYGAYENVILSDGDLAVFFKARDADALTAAFTEYSNQKLKAKEKPSVLKALQKLKDRAVGTPDKTRHKSQERDL